MVGTGPRTLSLRELNRALLSRQMLLGREQAAPLEAVRRLVGLQAQVPNPPYIGLWTRLQGFGREDLTRLMEERSVVRAPFVRSTLHLVAAEDYLSLWPAVQPALARALGAFFGKRARGVDVERLVSAAREALDEGPLAMGGLKEVLSRVEPDRDGDALNYAVRSNLPLVQVPPGGTWGSGSSASYATAASHLGRTPLADPGESLRALVLRYLAAFGPAGARDFQAWSGLTGAKSLFQEMKPELDLYRDEEGNELFDVPGIPLPPADVPAPPRFVPEYDNLVLSHADRRRVIAEEDRKKVFLSAARVRATFLIDGFVAGVWKIEKTRKSATLLVEPFAPLTPRDRDALAEEGERLLRLATDGQPELDVRFDNAG